MVKPIHDSLYPIHFGLTLPLIYFNLYLQQRSLILIWLLSGLICPLTKCKNSLQSLSLIHAWGFHRLLSNGVGTAIEEPPKIDDEHPEASLFHLSLNVGESTSAELIGEWVGCHQQGVRLNAPPLTWRANCHGFGNRWTLRFVLDRGASTDSL
jgi:hypothetical protein